METPKRRNVGIDFWLILPVILALLLSLVSFISLRYVIRSKDNAVLNHAPDLIQIQRLVIASDQMSEASRAYLFTRRSWNRAPFRRELIRRERDLLKEIRATRPYLPAEEGRGLLEEAFRLTNVFLARMDHVIALQDSGKQVYDVSSFYNRSARPVYEQLTRVLRQLVSFKEAQLENAISDSTRAGDQGMRLIILCGAMAIVLCALLGFIFIRIMGGIRNAEVSLRETLQVRDEFLSVASHELKNPVTALLTQTEMLRRMLDLSTEETPKSRSAQKALAARCALETQRLGALINELMDLTRLRLGKLTLARSRVELRELVREVVYAHDGEAARYGSAINVADGLPVLGNWDPMRISQVVYNLISNAIKYGDGKPICVRIENDAVRGCARLVVSDQGIGMTKETQSKIFRRFERGVSDQKIRGLGLGLYIVHQIVEAHGGKILVRSTVGKGSTFIVELPRGEVAQEPKAA